MSFSKNKRLTLCNPMGCSPPSSCVPGTSRTGILQWVAISFSRVFLTQGLNPGLLHCTQILCHLSHQGSPDSEALCDPRTVALQAPLPMGLHRQEYWSGLPFPPPGDLLNQGIKTRSPTMQADSLLSEPTGKPLRYHEGRYISVADDTSQLEKKKKL